MNAGLAGTGLIADDLYLLAHHDVTGKPLLQPRPLGIGLAGGLLAELMLGGSIGLRHDGTVAPQRRWPADALTRQIRDQIAAEQEPFQVREWLLFLARSAAASVAGRLAGSGYLTRVGGRLPWRPERWVPVDADWAFAPMVRVRTALDPGRPLSVHGAILAGLAVGCGLGFRLDQYQATGGRSVEEAVGQFRSGLRELVTQTQAAIDGALLAQRT